MSSQSSVRSFDPRNRLARARFRRWFGWYFTAAVLVFTLGGVLGAVTITAIDLGSLEGLAREFGSVFPEEITFQFIAVNNLRVALVIALGAVSFGIVSSVVLFFNGFVLGIVVGAAAETGSLLEAVALIVPHGVLELSAFFLLGGLTYRVTHRVVDYLRGVDETVITRQELFEAGVLVVVAAVAILLAAWIEVTLTQRIARAFVGPL